MPSETVKHFYEEIKLITEGIGKTDLSEKLILAAKEQDLDKMKSISRQFKKDNLELWGRMSLFYEEYNEHSPRIFCLDNKEGYIYNQDEINPINLSILLILSDESLDETGMFKNWRRLQYSLEEDGYKELAEFMDDTCINYLECLIEAFK